MTLSPKITAAMALAALCAACGPAPQSPDTVLMQVQEGGQAVSGTYRVGSFSQAQVRSMIGRVCTSAGFSGYGQSTSGDLNFFSASCAAQTRYVTGADARFVAQDDGSVDFFINYTQNGRPLETGGNFQI